MPSFAQTMLKASKATVLPIAKMAMGGTAGRVGLGLAAGGIYGMATNDRNNPNQGMGYVARMALYGGMLGGASRLFTPAVKFGAKGASFSGMPVGLKAMGSMVRGARSPVQKTLGAGATLAGMSLRYPMLAAGVVGGAYAFNQMNKTPYDSSLADSSLNQPLVEADRLNPGVRAAREQEMLQQMDSSMSPMGQVYSGSAMRNRRLMQSTMGLVQGLNTGRHG
jgi:hypothetical protein